MAESVQWEIRTPKRGLKSGGTIKVKAGHSVDVAGAAMVPVTPGFKPLFW